MDTTKHTYSDKDTVRMTSADKGSVRQQITSYSVAATIDMNDKCLDKK